MRLYIWFLTSWGAARLARLPSPGPALRRSPGLGFVAFSVLFRLVRGMARFAKEPWLMPLWLKPFIGEYFQRRSKPLRKVVDKTYSLL